MDFEWDDRKSERNEAQSGISFAVAARVFLSDHITRIDRLRDYGEVRVDAIGPIDGRVYCVCYTDRGHVRRIISARVAHRKERQAWLDLR